MRLQLHATDPQRLGPRLGQLAPEGCIRLPATLNVFVDVHGVLDADDEAAAANGAKPWILKPNRLTIATPGRWRGGVEGRAK